MGSTTPDLLTPEDLRLLRQETATVAGHTCKIVLLAPRHPAIGAEELRSSIASRLGRAPRLRRRLAGGRAAHGSAWVDDPGFDIAHHVRAVQLGGRGDIDELCGLVARRMAQRLDRSRPLWSLDVVSGLEGGQTALIWRIHHCMADGFAAMKLASAVLWDDQDAGTPGAGPPSPSPPQALQEFSRVKDARALRDTLRRELRPSSRRSPLAGRIGSARAVAFASVALADVKRAEKAAGGGVTVNDVLVCMVAGGLRRGMPALAATGPMRVQIPVSLHHAGEGDAVANRDSFILVDLDITEADPLRRLRAISRATAECKRHHDAELLDTFRGDLAGISRTLGHVAEEWSTSPRVFALSVSNVRGQSGELHVLGARVTAMHSVAEIAQRHALRVAALSAAGRLSFGLCVDPAVVPDVGAIARGIEHEHGELLVRATG